MTIAKIIGERSADDVISCDAQTKVADAVAMLAGKRIGALPVMCSDAVVGIISERDVIYRLAQEGRDCLDHPVEAIMTSPPVTVTLETTIDDALSMMTKRRFRHFPVMDNGTLIAFISIGDLVKSKFDEVEHEAEAMRSYIQTI